MAYIGLKPTAGENNSFRILDTLSSFTATFDGSSASIVSVGNDTITMSDHRFITGQRVTYNDGGGTAITGLSDGVYFIIKVDKNRIQLATNSSNAASGTQINLTGLGSGSSHTLNVAFDGVNTKFKITHNSGTHAKVTRASQLMISINGVLQQPHDSASPSSGIGIAADSVLVFSTAPATTDVVFGSIYSTNLSSFEISDNKIDNFTGDGSTTNFTMSKSPPDARNILVTLDGVVQHPSDALTTRAYTISSNVISFASAPASGVAIQVRHIGFAGGVAGSNAVDSVFGRIGDVVLTNSDDITVRNISAGLVTATTFTGGFAGNITGAAATFTGNVTIGGVLTYQDVTNIDALGIGTFREGIFLPDNKKAEFGNSAGSGDLQIFHDGNNSIIKDNGTGAIRILGGNTAFMNAAQNKTSATFNTATSVDLRYNNSLKFQTTNTGAIVTGILTATHFSGSSEVGIQSGGVQIGAGITQLNFIGTGNTFAVSGTTVDISISGGSAGAGGTWGSNAVGVHTDKIVGINTSTIAGSATSEGALQVTGNIGITEGLLTLDSNLYTSVSVPSGKNALLIGPTTVAVGATIDVAQGSTLVVV
tara:strand:+ start:90 stop:1868 length:1779 start_codon:yes stop_codon:yes gene_type:complete